MKLTYRIERADLSAFHWHHFWRSSTTWGGYGILLLLGILLVSYKLYGLGFDFQTVVTYVAGSLIPAATYRPLSSRAL